MLNEQQIEYIDGLRKNFPGVPPEQLSATLRASMWSEAEITAALLRYSGISAAPPEAVIPPPALRAVTSTPASEMHDEGGSPFDTPLPGSPRKWIVALLAISLTLLISGGAVFAYMNGYLKIPAFPWSKGEVVPQRVIVKPLLSSVLERLGEVRSASYEFAVDVAVKPREAGALPFMAGDDESAKYLPLQRDQDRFRDIQKIIAGLPRPAYGSSAWDGKKNIITPPTPAVYPASLASLDLPTKDPLGSTYDYAPSVDKNDFTLTVTFETQEAYDIAAPQGFGGRGTSTNKAVTFTNKNGNIYTSGFMVKPKHSPLFGAVYIEEYLSRVSSYLNGRIALSGTLDRQDELLPDAQFQVVANAEFADALMNFDVEFLKKGSTYYVRFNKSPDIIGTISTVQGKWVRFTQEDLSANGIDPEVASYLLLEKSKQEEAQHELFKRLAIILDAAEEENALVEITPADTEVVDGETFVVHHLELQREGLVPFYKRAIVGLQAERSTARGDMFTLDPSVIAYLESPEFITSFDYLAKNHTFTMWTDAKGFPVKMVYRLRIVPGDDVRSMQGKQFELTLSASLKNINAPVEVVAPQDTIPFEDLMVDLTGNTKEELQLIRQLENVDMIRTALASYKEWSGAYPATLDELTKKRSEVPKRLDDNVSPPRDPNDPPLEYLKAVPFTSRPLFDLATGKAYVYRMVGSDYALSYQVTLPQYRSEMPTYVVYQTTYSTSSGKPASSSPKIKMNVVAGQNTANEKVRSAEAAAASIRDKDLDGLPDALETYIGTNPNKKDTDGDSRGDGVELSTESDPLAPGN